MKPKSGLLTLFLLTTAYVVTFCQNQPKKSMEKMVVIETSKGAIRVKLYNETPQHRDNFLQLASRGFYDGVLFHRVIRDFMIQAGDSTTRQPQPNAQYGRADMGYTVEAEFNPALIHKKGALAAARTSDQVNPQRRSSGSQFYIVQGRKYGAEELQQVEMGRSQEPLQALFDKLYTEEVNAARARSETLNQDSIFEVARQKVMKQWEAMPHFAYPASQRELYTSLGGTPFLDGAYTVFGEVVEGLNVVDSIASTPTKPGDRPVEDVVILRMRVVE
jgi:cyclophilin family peptidyl-prolyl cis-trans isomerase